MKISITIPKREVSVASGAYSAPDMGTAEQLQYSDEELAERDKEEKARQEKEQEEERKKAIEKQKKDAAKTPKTDAENGDTGGDDGDDSEEEDDTDSEDDSDDEEDDEEESDDDDSEDDDSDDDDSDDDDSDDDEEATASANKVEPYPEAQSNDKESDHIPAETMEKVVDPAVEEERKEKREAENNKATEFSKEDPNSKLSEKKKVGEGDDSKGGQQMATASAVDFTLPYQDVKLRIR